MKNNLLVLTLVSLTYSAYGSLYTQKTTAIAAQESYPNFIVGLRNKAEDFLTREKIRMFVEIDDLRAQDLDYRADELFMQYKEAYFDLEDDIDTVFEKISREFLRKAAELDRKNASAKEKAALVAQTKENAQQIVDKELREYEKIIKK